MTIRIIYTQEPNYPATDQHPDAVRYAIVVDGTTFFVDAIGGEPSVADVRAILTPVTPVTALQARRALRAAGLYDRVKLAVDNAVDPDVVDSWEYAAMWHRDAHWITTLGVTLNLTSEQIDGLFLDAALR